MKVKKMMREKYLLKSCSINRKRTKKEEEGNEQTIQPADGLFDKTNTRKNCY